jgi:hypothetical protein
MTTNTDENVFIKNGELWIKPTLQDEKLITTNNVVDLTKQGICTSNVWSNCHAVTNVTNGTIINPVKSARINTKKGVSIQYGKQLERRSKQFVYHTDITRRTSGSRRNFASWRLVVAGNLDAPGGGHLRPVA